MLARPAPVVSFRAAECMQSLARPSLRLTTGKANNLPAKDDQSSVWTTSALLISDSKESKPMFYSPPLRAGVLGFINASPAPFSFLLLLPLSSNSSRAPSLSGWRPCGRHVLPIPLLQEIITAPPPYSGWRTPVSGTSCPPLFSKK